MEHDLLVEGRVVLQDSVEETQVGISNGKIAEIRKQGLKAARVIRAEGCLVFPGFIDAHAHLREPGWEHKEDFRTGTLAAAHGGVTTVFDMPNNPVPTTTVAAVQQKIRLAAQKAVVNAEFFAGVPPQSVEPIEEMKEFIVGYKAYLGRSTGGLYLPHKGLVKALPQIAQTGRPVSLHCEDQDTIDRMTKMMAGSTAPDAYCDMRPPESEIKSVQSALAASSVVKGLRANICHVSTKSSLALIESARAKGVEVMCEATLHHLFFTRKAMLDNGLLRTNPPLREEEDRASILDGLAAGRVNLLVTDHAPHTRVEKVTEGLAGVPGLDDYSHVVTWLIKTRGIDPVTLGRACSSTPAYFFELEDRGIIASGKRGDLSIVDLRTPQRVTPDSLKTKCGWSPYEGFEFPGGCRWTICGGKVLLDDFEVL